MGGTRTEIPADHLQIHLSHWIYHLRMAEAHFERNGLYLTPQERDYLVVLIKDLLEAASDAKAWLTNGQAAVFAAEAQAGMGSDHGHGGGTVRGPAGHC